MTPIAPDSRWPRTAPEQPERRSSASTPRTRCWPWPAKAGFNGTRYVAGASLAERYFANRTDGLRPSSGEISWSRPSDRSSSTLDAVADVRGVGRVQDLDGYQARVADVVEQALARAEQHRGDVEDELVDDSGGQRLAHRRGAAGDVDAATFGDGGGLLEGGVKAIGDEVKGRAARHLDRVARVMGEDEDRRVVGRLVAPPAAPVLIPAAANRAEHVAAHDVRAARTHQPVARRDVR